MITCLCPDRESTQALGARLAPTLRAGDVILLSGDMGAGKSEFARGVARGLGLALRRAQPILYHPECIRRGPRAAVPL